MKQRAFLPVFLLFGSLLAWESRLAQATPFQDSTTSNPAPAKPYDVYPDANPPYYRVRFEPSTAAGELVYGANFTLWVPPEVSRLRGVIVHQHGCGEGSCKSGLTGAYDLHWQALARKHGCALLSPAYEQPDKADCQMWCDPRKGSAKAFLKALEILGERSSHPELSDVPWALWGHSGGGHWCGGMAILYPERVIAAWLRSGVPLVEPASSKGNIQNYSINAGVLAVPIMLNLGTKEGVSVKDDRFSGVWPANQEFFNALRSQGGLIGISIDPLTSHECGNQRYLAVPWLDECLSKRLPDQTGQALRAIKSEEAWLTSADGSGTKIEPNINHASDATSWAWLPSERVAKLWVQYSKDRLVLDDTPPPEPTQVLLDGEQLNWECQADVESGLAYFVVEKDGKEIARVPEKGNNPFGRPVFQGLQYSDTPPMPLVVMSYRIAPTDSSGQQTDSKTKEAVDPKGNDGKDAGRYTVHAVNTAGQVSKKTRAVVR